ncbi:MAG: MBOAT family protein [Magnetococcales bacterium]|nr:MBOAT family protein [Magnetococcales bacterium]
MLFNSPVFLFLFLPLTLGAIHWLSRRDDRRPALALLTTASLFFYGWWNPGHLPLILASMGVNFGLGLLLQRLSGPANRLVLILGLAANLGLLGYYKYTAFVLHNFNAFLDSPLPVPAIVLPLGISFFTFQQMAYLVDTARGEAAESRFLPYALFVTFFPQLIAGPIVHRRTVMHQFVRPGALRLQLDNMVIGLTVFILGLAKKVLIADSLAHYANPVFTAAEQGLALSWIEAWGGALAYTLQIYFDFSGYSEMALGLGFLFGIQLPLNFNSPYKSLNIIDFWRRWHITLSHFLRDYLYIPLGGSRLGATRRHGNLMITMLLGGLWHGAGWTFVVWGGLHGGYLVINHLWRRLRPQSLATNWQPGGTVLAWGLTFGAVVVAWVFFRANSLAGAWGLLRAMFGGNGLDLPRTLAPWLAPLVEAWPSTVCRFDGAAPHDLFSLPHLALWLAGLLPLVVWFPNVMQLVHQHRPHPELPVTLRDPWHYRWLTWNPGPAWGLFMALVLGLCMAHLSRVSEFLYFQF